MYEFSFNNLTSFNVYIIVKEDEGEVLKKRSNFDYKKGKMLRPNENITIEWDEDKLIFVFNKDITKIAYIHSSYMVDPKSMIIDITDKEIASTNTVLILGSALSGSWVWIFYSVGTRNTLLALIFIAYLLLLLLMVVYVVASLS